MRLGKRIQITVSAGVLALAAAISGGAAMAHAAAPPGPRDCRTYSSVTICGGITLDAAQRACVAHAVAHGMTERRAEVECVSLP